MRPHVPSLLFRIVPALLFALMAAFPPGVSAQDETRADLLFRNARVFDGMGNPWIRADVAVRGDRIVGVGRLQGWTAEEVLNLDGLYLAPGFIDPHSHAGDGLADPERSHAHPQLAQGVTTLFVNPDGGGPVDLAAQRSNLLRDGLGVNVAQLVPHGSIRAAVVGMEDRAPSSQEMEAMRELVRRGMEEGAFGLSSGPFYVPGSFSDAGELVELARVAGSFGGVYTSHIRDEGDYSIGVLAAVEEVITIAREAEIRGIVTHVKALGPPVWGFSAAIVHRIARARDEGVELFTDQYPYNASATSLAAALVPPWAQEGGRDALLARLEDPGVATALREGVAENLARRGGAERIQLRRHTPDPTLEGLTLAEVAHRRRVDPVEAALSLIAEFGTGIVSFNMHDDDVATLMRAPWNMTSSDGEFPVWGEGVPHPRAYGSFPRKLRHYALELGVVSLEDGIRSMTSLPAQVHRLEDRGVIRVGAVADLVVFDLELLRDRATFTEPHQLSEGMVHVLVNGVFAIREGALTEARAGKVLRLAR